MKGQTLQEWAGRSRIFALVFTDIVDSTKLANELKDPKWIDLLKKHFRQATELMVKYDGYHEIKIIGDSFMVAFYSAADALDFVLDLYEDTGDQRIKIRAGIHVGSAEIIEDDIYGIMVNYTKRIESTDNRWGIHVSNFAKTEIDNKGRHAGLSWDPREVEFKGFPAPQKIWRVVDRRWAITKPYRPPINRAGTSQNS
jgi:class 3 adenylate cyclase